MKLLLKILPLVGMIFLVHCKTSRPVGGNVPSSAHVSAEGFITCFESGLTAKGQPVYCEASAILYDGTNIFFANDKDMPDSRGSVFYWPYARVFEDTSKPAVYVNSPVFKQGKKYEDFALTPDGKIVFLTTAFDRVQPGSKDWDSYNTLLYWQVGNQSHPQVISANNTDSTSVYLRDKISKALASQAFPQGMPYFKIEGLAATSDMLYFGIREEGKKFDDFKYTAKILSIPYHINNGFIELGDSLKVFSNPDLSSLAPSITQPIGISSIEYDRFNKRFLILTSYESGEKLGAYLWTASLDDLQKNTMTLVRDAANNPLSFTHKAEDIIIVNKKKVIIINDDDRVLTSAAGRVRQPNQAAYTIIAFK